MTIYFSTFISGLQDVVERELKNRLDGVKVKLLLDGLVIYESNQPVEQIRKIRFFNNSFLLLYQSGSGLSTFPDGLIQKFIKSSEIRSGFRGDVLRGVESIRVVASKENQIVAIGKKQLLKIESFLSEAFGLRIDRGNPDLEIWFIERNDSLNLVGIRITKKPNYEKVLHKGELRPELANTMCLLGGLKSSDVVLDPFAGYGAIPLECAIAFTVKEVIAGENNQKVFELLQKKVSQIKPKIVVGKWNALRLNALTHESIDKIITDPPWGLYGDAKLDIQSFYTQMFHEFVRLLKPGGTIILLTAQKEILEEVINQFPGLKIEEKYNILVSGKKAGLFKINKI